MNGMSKKPNKLATILLFGKLGNGTVGQALVMWIAVSIWSFYIISGTILAVLLGVIFICKETRQAWLSDKRWLALTLSISGLSLFSSLLSGNGYGIIVTLALFIVMSLGGCAKAVMTDETFRKAEVFCGYGSIIAFMTAVSFSAAVSAPLAAATSLSLSFSALSFGV